MSSLARASCGYLAVDTDRIIIDANDEIARLLDRSREALVGQRLSVLLSAGSRIFFHSHIFPELMQRPRIDEVYLSLSTATGAEVPVLFNGWREEREGALTFHFVLLPMHRRHLFERELIAARQGAEAAARAEQEALSQLRTLQGQLAKQDWLAALGTLAAGVAHELNNPLTYIVCNLELMLQAIEPPVRSEQALRAEIHPLLDETRIGVERIRDIVKSLKGMSRSSEQPRAAEPVDLQKVIDSAIRVAGHELRPRARVTVEVSVPPPIALANEGPLLQVMTNLLVNAAQAMPPRALDENRITVRARPGERGGVAIIEVEDNGAGIPAEVRPRIFDPFFTTKSESAGTGLGLSVCHNLVSALGGSIEVQSESGRGTTFAVTLPLAPAPARAVEAAALPMPPTAPARFRALVVDDEEGVARILKRVLKDYDLEVAHDGREALARVRGGERFDVVLCDLMMPGATGMEVHAAICQIDPALAERMIFMTGGAFSESARKFLDWIPNPRLLKPFSIQEARAVCRQMCERSLAGSGYQAIAGANPVGGAQLAASDSRLASPSNESPPAST